ncbi:MAG TPA: NADH-quinone oxidoreductase subunit NuoE [Acidobacteriota bacterium]|nr:NADH-quinone oxidoreductase subunit NuoE [Acidobacteriota bacterium]
MNATLPTDHWREILEAGEKTLGPQITRYIRQVLQQDHPESRLISVLHKVQERFGFLGRQHLDAVALLLGVPAAHVSGVASFYHFFRLVEPGRHIISICMGTACYVKGAERIADRVRRELKADFGQTSSDGLFTLSGSRCLGTCGLAPILMIGEDVYGKVTPDQVPALLEKYRQPAPAAERLSDDRTGGRRSREKQ